MKKIGVIVDNEFYNDVRVLNECKILANHGFNVNVLCLDFGNQIAAPEIKNLTVQKVKVKRNIKNYLFAFNNTFGAYTKFWTNHIDKFIKDCSISTLHVHDLYMSKAAHIACKKNNISFNLDLHENYPAAVLGYKWMHKFPSKFLIKPKKWQKLEAEYLGYPNKVIVLSDSFKNTLVEKYSFLKSDQFVIYPNVPNIDELLNYSIDPSIKKEDNDFILFYFGVISQRRGIHTVFEALKILVTPIPNIKLLLIGPIDKNEQTEMLELMENSIIKKHIIYHPWKDISLLPSFLQISDICLSPILKNDQHESGVANKIFQYMLFERPIIVSDCKPQKEIVETDNCGLSFKSEDVDDLVDKITQLYNDRELCSKFGFNGKAAVESKYNMKTIGENLINLYNN